MDEEKETKSAFDPNAHIKDKFIYKYENITGFSLLHVLFIYSVYVTLRYTSWPTILFAGKYEFIKV